ncbi:MAG: SARP family transcriptional regulator, partial [Actinobacteria bacterium]|nr:SARP family transcriptional regulator [Actinomycetota bacterium]NIS31492.1 SARP family transcriptional regulator [Actinomycetota bacterium]NIT95725.1 SARP family transcriptional regulator [Actinomycetota bacterium]NIU19411.1 SARP family transcriptional regulator [Actinomycetota bacterium]NIU66610.1 SARP family transcriptional regulator [Actinomycetota bacterium]
ALYRSDRQPEALRAYQRARDVFAELGVGPSADLDQLEQQILLRDPAL